MWDKNTYLFPNFESAKKFLLDELFWLGQDLHHEPTMQAWERVAQWSFEEGRRYRVRAGAPAATYSILPIGDKSG